MLSESPVIGRTPLIVKPNVAGKGQALRGDRVESWGLPFRCRQLEMHTWHGFAIRVLSLDVGWFDRLTDLVWRKPSR